MTMSLSRPSSYREYVGNPHVHSVYSDGAATYRQIGRAAAQAGLDFVIVTDHNVRPEGLEGFYDGVLVLSGEELHNVRADPQRDHLLVFGTEREMAPYAFGPASTLIQAANSFQGIVYIAHPVERSSRLSPDLAAIPWTSWPPVGTHGMEIWNYMSEFKGLLWCRLVALLYALWPELGIRGPYRATLRLWDELLNQGYRVAALGGADAHGQEYRWGPLKRTILPYQRLFRGVNTHILTREPLSGEDVARDKALVYEALRAGRTWAAYDRPHSTRGFQCLFRSDVAVAFPGESLRRLGALQIHVGLPAPGTIILRRDGKTIRRSRGRQLLFTTEEPGTYRIEVYRRYLGQRVGWIFPSPIYVT